MRKQHDDNGDIAGTALLLPKRRVVQLAVLGLCFAVITGCNSYKERQRTRASEESSRARTEPSRSPEPMRDNAKSVQPQVQSEINRMEAEKRAELLKEAQTALEDTRAAMAALDAGDRKAALAALERAIGKLDVVVARDPKLGLAPVSVNTTILDLYATIDSVKAAIDRAKADLSDNRVQQARALLQTLASEARIDVTELPLATYPAAIRAVVPMIEAGKTAEAKTALQSALNTLVIETIVIPLPRVRAQEMLKEADQLASKPNRSQEENQRLNTLIEGARYQLQLAETLGYGRKEDYKPLYSQLDEIKKKTEGGKYGKGFFDRISESVKNFKFT